MADDELGHRVIVEAGPVGRGAQPPMKGLRQLVAGKLLVSDPEPTLPSGEDRDPEPRPIIGLRSSGDQLRAPRDKVLERRLLELIHSQLWAAADVGDVAVFRHRALSWPVASTQGSGA